LTLTITQSFDDLPQVFARGEVAAAEFTRIVAAEEPVIFKNALAAWPALDAGRESVAAMTGYLKSLDAGKPAPILEARASSDGWFMYQPDLRDFSFAHRERRIGETLDHMERLLGQPGAPFIAIQSLPLAEHMPQFMGANPAPFLPPQVMPRIWIGGKVRTQTHNDPDHNLACVVAGRRRFLLFPPEQVSNLYVGPIDRSFPPPLSLVNPEAPDFERFPKFRRALAAARIAWLEAGDALLIPKYWWHHVTSLEPFNVLVNYWWGNDAKGLERPLDCFLTALLSLKDLPPRERAYWREMFELHVFRPDGGDPIAHIPPALQGLLGPLSPALRQKLRQQLKMAYLKS
jgi:hypothetical protein